MQRKWVLTSRNTVTYFTCFSAARETKLVFVDPPSTVRA
jgi:hypothetical protein